jgi:hypothetical protein
VYELELNIPNEEILGINYDEQNVNFLDIESANSIERDFFGLTAPAFTLKIKDRNTGEDFTYLISEYEDVLEYEEDLKRAIATEILSEYGLYTSDYNDEWDSDWGTWEIRDYLKEVFEALEDPEMQDYPEVQAYSKHLGSLKQKLASQSDDVEEYIIELLENEYIQKIRERHYPYYEDDTVLWGGDSTELAGIAKQHGYKVLWCSDWISSGNEVVIVDDSIYNNGLVVVEDCSDAHEPRENSRGISVDFERVSNLVHDIRDFIWNNWNDLDHSEHTIILEGYETQFINAQNELVTIPIVIEMTEDETHAGASYDPETGIVYVYLETESLPRFVQILNPNQNHPRSREFRNYLIAALVHEITHALDAKEEIRRKRNKYTPSDFSSRYYNTPIEVNAFANQIIAEILMSGETYRTVEDALDSSETWQEEKNTWSTKSKRTIMKRVYSRLFEN